MNFTTRNIKVMVVGTHKCTDVLVIHMKQMKRNCVSSADTSSLGSQGSKGLQDIWPKYPALSDVNSMNCIQ